MEAQVADEVFAAAGCFHKRAMANADVWFRHLPSRERARYEWGKDEAHTMAARDSSLFHRHRPVISYGRDEVDEPMHNGETLPKRRLPLLLLDVVEDALDHLPRGHGAHDDDVPVLHKHPEPEELEGLALARKGLHGPVLRLVRRQRVGVQHLAPPFLGRWLLDGNALCKHCCLCLSLSLSVEAVPPQSADPFFQTTGTVSMWESCGGLLGQVYFTLPLALNSRGQYVPTTTPRYSPYEPSSTPNVSALEGFMLQVRTLRTSRTLRTLRTP